MAQLPLAYTEKKTDTGTGTSAMRTLPDHLTTTLCMGSPPTRRFPATGMATVQKDLALRAARVINSTGICAIAITADRHKSTLHMGFFRATLALPATGMAC